MKIYLAARCSRHAEMKEYAAALRELGHHITSRWINGEHQITDAELSASEAEAKRVRFAQEDIEDLRAADCVISFTERPRETATRGGRHVEFGMALALGKRVIVVGHRENVFHGLPEVEFFATWPEVHFLLRCPSMTQHEVAARSEFLLGGIRFAPGNYLITRTEEPLDDARF